MIIVSQDKKRIVNFDNLIKVYTTHCEEDNTGYFIRFETVDSLYEDLGEYATEERAKEVLIEIAQCYCNTKQYEYVSNMPNYSKEKVDYLNELAEKAVVYKMPKE